MADTELSAKDRAEIEQAKKNLEARSFIIVLDRPIPEGHEIVLIKKLRKKGGKYRYKVASSDSKKDWY